MALEKYESALESKNVKAQIALQPAIRFNGGGHINHSVPESWNRVDNSFSGRIFVRKSRSRNLRERSRTLFPRSTGHWISLREISMVCWLEFKGADGDGS